jgi:hypothetical protein
VRGQRRRITVKRRGSTIAVTPPQTERRAKGHRPPDASRAPTARAHASGLTPGSRSGPLGDQRCVSPMAPSDPMAAGYRATRPPDPGPSRTCGAPARVRRVRLVLNPVVFAKDPPPRRRDTRGGRETSDSINRGDNPCGGDGTHSRDRHQAGQALVGCRQHATLGICVGCGPTHAPQTCSHVPANASNEWRARLDQGFPGSADRLKLLADRGRDVRGWPVIRHDASRKTRASRTSFCSPRCPPPRDRTRVAATTRTSWPARCASAAIRTASVPVSRMTRADGRSGTQVTRRSVRRRPSPLMSPSAERTQT